MASIFIISAWILSAVAIVVVGLAYLVIPQLPQSIQDLLLYGKVRGKRTEKSFVRLIEVPKRWFTYFYLLGAIVNGYVAYVVATVYLLGQTPPPLLVNTLKYLNPQPDVATSGLSALLLIVMMFVQNGRRLLECVLVSVYSKSTMNLLHFALGVALYSTFHLAVLSQAPDLSSHRVNDVDGELLTWNNYLGGSLFLWASYQHHVAHRGLGALRKNNRGAVTSYGHKLPTGGWFELVSCPHYFFEIVIYLAFQLIGGMQHYTLWSITVFVICNQLLAGHLSHLWYKAEFKDAYPRHRRAVIPFVF